MDKWRKPLEKQLSRHGGSDNYPPYRAPHIDSGSKLSLGWIYMHKINSEELELSDDGLLLLHDGVPLTGLAFESYPNGRDETEYVSGQKWGVARRWAANGVLVAEEHLACNSRHGMTREWFSDGAPKLVAHYELGILVKQTTYGADGSVVEEFVLDPDHPQFRTLQLLREGSVARAIREREEQALR